MGPGGRAPSIDLNPMNSPFVQKAVQGTQNALQGGSTNLAPNNVLAPSVTGMPDVASIGQPVVDQAKSQITGQAAGQAQDQFNQQQKTQQQLEQQQQAQQLAQQQGNQAEFNKENTLEDSLRSAYLKRSGSRANANSY